jgi:hypothetical protein
MCHSPANNGKQFALLTDDSYLISDNGQTWHLYHFDDDPREQHDLAGQPPWRPELQAAQHVLQQVQQSIINRESSERTQTWLTRQNDGGRN